MDAYGNLQKRWEGNDGTRAELREASAEQKEIKSNKRRYRESNQAYDPWETELQKQKKKVKILEENDKCNTGNKFNKTRIEKDVFINWFTRYTLDV